MRSHQYVPIATTVQTSISTVTPISTSQNFSTKPLDIGPPPRAVFSPLAASEEVGHAIVPKMAGKLFIYSNVAARTQWWCRGLQSPSFAPADPAFLFRVCSWQISIWLAIRRQMGTKFQKNRSKKADSSSGSSIPDEGTPTDG